MNKPLSPPNIPMTDVVRYVTAPRFMAERQRVDATALAHLIQLLFLCLLILLVVSGLVGAIVSGVQGSVPENANQTLGQDNPRMLLLVGILVAPVLEEVIFRSWLGGLRASIIGLPILAAVMAVLATVGVDMAPAMSLGLAVILGLLILAVARQYVSRTANQQAAARRRLFPYAFYGSTVLFALSHLSNYEGGLSSPILLLAVLPQGLVGLLLGYVRMRFGMISAILFHAAYNGVLVALFLLAQALSATPVNVPDAAQMIPSTSQALVGSNLSA